MKRINIFLAFILSVTLFSCNNYGEKVKNEHIEIYYKDGVKKADAEKTAQLFYDVDIAAGNATIRKSMQLCKISDTVCLRMVVREGYYTTAYEKNFYALSNYISDSVFNGAPVNVDLTDDHFKSKKFLHYKKVENF